MTEPPFTPWTPPDDEVERKVETIVTRALALAVVGVREAIKEAQPEASEHDALRAIVHTVKKKMVEFAKLA